MDLQALLDDLIEQGSAGSAGIFTMDPEHARKKLREFQLEEAGAYILYLVAAGVAAGARSVTVATEGPTCKLWLDCHWSASEIENIFSWVFSRQAAPGLRYLGLGVNTSLALPKSRVVLSCSGVRLEMSADNILVVRNKESKGTTIEVTRASQAPELPWLESRCKLAPIPVHVNGSSIAYSNLLGSPLVSEKRGPWQLCVGGEGGEFQGVYAVVHGLSYRLDLPALKGHWGFIQADHLQADLSLNQLVQNPDYHNTLCQLHEGAEILLEKFHNLQQARAREGAVILERLGQVAIIHNEPALARRRLEAAVELRQRLDGPNHRSLKPLLASLITILTQLGDTKGAEKLRRRAREIASSDPGSAKSASVPIDPKWFRKKRQLGRQAQWAIKVGGAALVLLVAEFLMLCLDIGLAWSERIFQLIATLGIAALLLAFADTKFSNDRSD